MTVFTQREFNELVEGQQLQTIKAGQQWRWRWGSWHSKLYDFLEVRPWTPQVIAGKICFSAIDGDYWRVIWGDSEGPALEDAYGILEYNNEPIYVAKKDNYYFLIRGNKLRTELFKEQINFRIGLHGVEIMPFRTQQKGNVKYIEDWHELFR